MKAFSTRRPFILFFYRVVLDIINFSNTDQLKVKNVLIRFNVLSTFHKNPLNSGDIPRSIGVRTGRDG